MGAKMVTGSLLSGTKGKETRFQPCLSGSSAVVVSWAIATRGQASHRLVAKTNKPIPKTIRELRIMVRLLLPSV